MKIKKLAVFVLFSLLTLNVFATVVSSPEWGFALDLPEGFTLLNSSATEQYLFYHENLEVFTAITVYTTTEYDSKNDILRMLIDKLEPKGEAISFQWENRDTTLLNFTFDLAGEELYSWATISSLPEKNAFLCIHSYTSLANVNPLKESLLLSIIDSLALEKNDWFAPGPITTFSYPEEKRIKNHIINFDNTDLEISLEDNTIEANQYVIDREYSVLSFYVNTPFWKEAWKRFYRVIYRDAYKRLESTGKEVKAYLDKKTSDKKEQIQLLLSWVQVKPYDRNHDGSDFTSLPAILFDVFSDCDSRSLMIALLLQQMDYNTVLFVSREYSHALLGIEFETNGAKMMVNDTWFVVGETTASVDLGLIDSTMSDESKWLGIDFIQK
ncbi:MAG: hypothetical protein ACRC4W_04365 [Treponemataceae bacterium]